MQWFRDAKFGMFLHGGESPCPAGQGEWYMEQVGARPDEYRKLAFDQEMQLFRRGRLRRTGGAGQGGGHEIRRADLTRKITMIRSVRQQAPERIHERADA